MKLEIIKEIDRFSKQTIFYLRADGKFVNSSVVIQQDETEESIKKTLNTIKRYFDEFKKFRETMKKEVILSEEV